MVDNTTKTVVLSKSQVTESTLKVLDRILIKCPTLGITPKFIEASTSSPTTKNTDIEGIPLL